MLQLSALHVYPIKGIAGLSVSEAEVLPRGLRGDRRWLLVDADNRFLSQRELPIMSQIRAEAVGDGWRVSAPNQASLTMQPPTAQDRLEVTVWSDTVSAQLADATAHAWFSTALGQPVRLVYMDEAAQRPVDPDYSQPGDQVSFADAFPLLIANEASLADLSQRIGEPLSMARFRPNLVISGAEAWAEDDWQRLRIGEVEIDLVKPCSRCQVTTLDPSTASAHPRSEPLRTLATFRKQGGKVMFAVNAIARNGGSLRVGMPVVRLA